MKNILLLTDFSTNAWNALYTAVKLYAAWDCKFYLLHTFEPKDWKMVHNQGDSEDFEINSPVEHDLEERMEETKNYLIKHNDNSNHSFEALLMAGSLVDTVRVLISRYDLDLVVMGTHGKTDSKKVFAGNNALNVLRQVMNCNILLVPNSFDFQRLRTVVYPTEFKHFTPKYVLTPLIELLQKWQSEVHVVHVAKDFRLTEQQKMNKVTLKKRLQGLQVNFDQVNQSASVIEDILGETNFVGSDMIVVTKYSHGLFESLIHEPILKKIGSKTNVPLLVMPDFEPQWKG
ncbi:universal stress protein [[Muricauda] lutisoli]|uniref:Universal stress protein n=1 Tax=[Muricauda] lutisoli TaxID=2816035 RepID=A0ABS3F0J9_9FLAO|nr:universal stress protein [[Muricauda] lutisoli]MBO0331868.1 universal stress protein [[Muricauda] lutisoli]